MVNHVSGDICGSAFGSLKDKFSPDYIICIIHISPMVVATNKF